MKHTRLLYSKAKDFKSQAREAHHTYPFYEEPDWVLSKPPCTEPEVAPDPFLNPASLIVQEGKEAGGSMEDAPEGPQDEEYVILHLYPKEQVEEVPSPDEPQEDTKPEEEPEPKAGKLQFRPLPQACPPLALVLNSQF